MPETRLADIAAREGVAHRASPPRSAPAPRPEPEGQPQARTSIRRETATPGSAPVSAGFSGIAKERQRSKPRTGTVRILPAAGRGLGARIAARKAANDGKTAGRRRKTGYAARASIALFVLACLGVAAYFAVPEATSIRRVSVHGMNALSEADVVGLMGLAPESNLVNVDLRAIESRIASDPRVASVAVVRNIPDGLVVRLSERKPVAALLIEIEGISRPVLVDAEGVAFMDAAGQGFPADLPVLSGIAFENFRLGQRLPEYLSPVLRDLRALSASKPELISAFSEIRVVKLAEHEAELLLYPMHRPIPIRMPPALDAGNLASALLVIDILSARESASRIEEIDFRTGTVVYRSKEGRSG